MSLVGDWYSFQPDASDNDGDALEFSVVNKPGWADFDPLTGTLQGLPKAEDVGIAGNIVISVTDSNSVVSLPSFAIVVKAFTLAWQPPTENEDGTPLTDLAGYRIYYGTSSGKYSEEVLLDSPGLTSYVIDNLAPGTYFLVMTSINSRDIESKPTPELKFEIGT